MIDGQNYEFPHCNPEVLHAPGECYYCDCYPKRQAARSESGPPFTPNEVNGWSGNVAVKPGQIHEHMGARFMVGGGPSRSHVAKLSLWQRFLRWIYNSWGGQ